MARCTTCSTGVASLGCAAGSRRSGIGKVRGELLAAPPRGWRRAGPTLRGAARVNIPGACLPRLQRHARYRRLQRLFWAAGPRRHCCVMLGPRTAQVVRNAQAQWQSDRRPGGDADRRWPPPATARGAGHGVDADEAGTAFGRRRLAHADLGVLRGLGLGLQHALFAVARAGVRSCPSPSTR